MARFGSHAARLSFVKVTNPKLDHKMNLFVFNLMFVGANNWRPKIAWQARTREADEKGLKRENEETLFFLIISILFTNP